MKIKIDRHTLERAEERGVTKKEIDDVIRTGFPTQARHGRTAKAKVYPYNQTRGRRYYEQKRVEVIYVNEPDAIVTVTVYAFYGKWEPQDEDLL